MLNYYSFGSLAFIKNVRLISLFTNELTNQGNNKGPYPTEVSGRSRRIFLGRLEEGYGVELKFINYIILVLLNCVHIITTKKYNLWILNIISQHTKYKINLRKYQFKSVCMVFMAGNKLCINKTNLLYY